MNYTKFEQWVLEIVSETEKKQQITKKEQRVKGKENIKVCKEMEDLSIQFSELSISDNPIKCRNQNLLLKLDFEQMQTISDSFDKDYLEWVFSQMKLYFKQKKISQVQKKIDFIFKLLFNEQEISYLYQGLCSRLGHEELSLQKEEQEHFIKSLFIDIFDA